MCNEDLVSTYPEETRKEGTTLSTFGSFDTPVGHKFDLQGYVNGTYVRVY